MRFLADSSVARLLVVGLAAVGHEIVSVLDWEVDPGDEVIMQKPHAQQRVLITQDKDFATLALVVSRPHCGLVRLPSVPPSEQLAIARQVIDERGDDLNEGRIITAIRGRIRSRSDGPV